MGSGQLIQSLMQRDLIDEHVLLIHPLVPGAGRRLFPDRGAPATLSLVNSKDTDNGVIVATYRPTRDGDVGGLGISATEGVPSKTRGRSAGQHAGRA
jgi:hypothetical protein